MTNRTINNNNKNSDYQDSYGAVAETFGLKIGTPAITIDTAIFYSIIQGYCLSKLQGFFFFKYNTEQ